MYFIYFAKSLRNNKVYCGFTSKNPKERVYEHNKSTNKWSSQNKPLKLIYYENYVCKDDALLRESFYKTGIGKAIKKLIIDNIETILGL